MLISLSYYLYVCAAMNISHSKPLEVREQLQGISSLLFHVSSGDQTQVIELDGKHHYPLPISMAPRIDFLEHAHSNYLYYTQLLKHKYAVKSADATIVKCVVLLTN